MKKELFITFLVLLANPLKALVVGSNTTSYRNSFFTFPASDSDNEIRGFVSMDEGFALEDSSTMCLFNGFERVKSKIYLNEGRMDLNTNLFLENVSTFTNLGSFYSYDGGLKSLVLAENTQTLGLDTISTVTFENIELILRGNCTLDCPMLFSQKNRIIGNGAVLTLGQNGAIVVAEDGDLTMQNLLVTNVASNNIRCLNDDARIRLINTNWDLSDTATFSAGSLLFTKKCSFKGNAVFSYESAYTSTIEKLSEWKLADDLYLMIGKHPVSQAQPLAFEDSTSIIRFDKSSFQITNQGMQMTKGKAVFNNNVAFEFLSTDTTNGVIIGDGTAANDFILEFNAAAVLNFDAGHFVYNNTITDGTRSKSKTAKVVRTPSSNIYNLQNQTLSNFTFKYTSLSVPPIQVLAGKTVSYSDVAIELPDFEFHITGQQYSSTAELLAGNHQVTLSKGTFPLGVLVSGTGNKIIGNGTLGGPVIFLSPSAELAWENLGVLDSSITFNGATLSLDSDLVLKESASLVGPGTIELQGKSLVYPISNSIQSSNLTINGPGDIVLKSNYALQGALTLNNNCGLKGEGNILNFDGGSLTVGQNSHIVLQNIVLNSIGSTDFSCTDSSGSITFDETKMIFAENFQFSDGALRFKNKNRLMGDKIFAYQSNLTSTILADAILQFDSGFTFSYDPQNLSAELIEMIDDTSTLVLNGATLLATSSGLELTSGTLRVKRTSYVASDSEINLVTKRGISLGNEVDDLNVVIAPEASLTLMQGVLEYRNLNSDSLIFLNNLSAITIQSGAALQLFENIDVRPGFIIFENVARLYSANGIAKIIGSINPRGTLVRRNFTP